MIIRIFIIVLMLACFNTYAQPQEELHSIKTGAADISVYFGDSLLNVVNKEVRMVPDFETNEIYIKIDPSTFDTGRDSLDSYISDNIFEDIQYKGKMDLNYYSPEKNRVESFRVVGELKVGNKTIPVDADGTILSELNTVNVSGKIRIHFDIKLSDYDLPKYSEYFGEYACVEITQVLLQQRK